MKSFTEEYPISIVASTQRIVHSPKIHTFGSVIYSSADDTFYEEEPYHNIEVVDRIGSGDAYVSGVLYSCWPIRETTPKLLRTEMPPDLSKIQFPEIFRPATAKKLTPLSVNTIPPAVSRKWTDNLKKLSADTENPRPGNHSRRGLSL